MVESKNKYGKKFYEDEATLPEDLRPIYRKMVDYYVYSALVRVGFGRAAYKVIADLVMGGWRLSAEPHPDSLFLQDTAPK